MTQTADRHLTPEQERTRNLIDRYGHIAALMTWGVLALGALYLAALYVLTSR